MLPQRILYYGKDEPLPAAGAAACGAADNGLGRR